MESFSRMLSRCSGRDLEQRPRVVGTWKVDPQLAVGDRRPAGLLQPGGDERRVGRDGVLNHSHRRSKLIRLARSRQHGPPTLRVSKP